MSRFNVLLPRAGPRSIVDPVGPRPAQGADATPGKVRFEDILEGTLGGGHVKVSAHAQERARTRGIPLGHVELDRIAQAMDQVARKGGREALVIGPDAAFVVSVPNRTVITAMARDELKDNVFTQIDSAVIVD
jgi:flagellar operon protein